MARRSAEVDRRQQAAVVDGGLKQRQVAVIPLLCADDENVAHGQQPLPHLCLGQVAVLAVLQLTCTNKMKLASVFSHNLCQPSVMSAMRRKESLKRLQLEKMSAKKDVS